jgi:two-component system sensor histidine kinase CpxA
VRSLAVKIFLSFWLIHAVIFVVLGLVRSERGAAFLVGDLRRHGRMAVEMLERDGPVGCATLLSLFESHDNVRLSLYDAERRRLCALAGADVGPDADLLTRTDGYTGLRDGQRVAVVTLQGGRGATYSAVAVSVPRTRDDRQPPFPFDLLLTAVIVSGVVCFVLARYLAHPLGQMRAATQRLAAGDLDARVGAGVGSRNDEIGDLVRDFDAMAVRISSLMHAQSQLLSDISHELRSPLARLNVALELARRKAGDAAVPDLDRIQTETERMNDLIGQLLELSRAESDERAAHVEKVDLEEVLRAVVADADFEARRQGKSVTVDIQSPATVAGDPDLLARAVENVVRNAVRYTAPSTAVEATLTSDPAAVTVTVRDRGPGVPEGDLEKIFAPFHRVESARSRGRGGVGLGLAIAKRAVALHSGTVVARNAEGGGLVVTVRLPRA